MKFKSKKLARKLCQKYGHTWDRESFKENVNVKKVCVKCHKVVYNNNSIKPLIRNKFKLNRVPRVLFQ